MPGLDEMKRARPARRNQPRPLSAQRRNRGLAVVGTLAGAVSGDAGRRICAVAVYLPGGVEVAQRVFVNPLNVGDDTV